MEQLGLRSARAITETREALDAENLEQMLSPADSRAGGPRSPWVIWSSR
jgi:hypothetical protein